MEGVPPRPRSGTALRVAVAATLLAACTDGSGTGPDPTDPLLWEFATPGAIPLHSLPDARGGPHLFVTLKERGLLVLRMHDGSAEEVARVEPAALGGLAATALAQAGARLYVGLGDFFAPNARAGLAVIDISDPAEPTVSALWVSPGTMTGVTAIEIAPPWVYVSAKRDGLMVFDVGEPDTVRLAAALLPDPDFPLPNPPVLQHPNARGMELVEETLFLANDAGGLRAIDVSNPADPREIGKYINPGVTNKPQAYNDVVVRNGIAYVSLDYCGLEVVDVSDPEDMQPLGWWNPWACETAANTWFNSAGHTNEIVLDAARRLAYVSAGASELVIVDVSDPANPQRHAGYEHADDEAAWGVSIRGEETFLTYITALIPYRGTWAGIRAIRTIR